MGIDRNLLTKAELPDTVPYKDGMRLAGWSEKDELSEIVDELSMDTKVDGQGDWARLAGGKEIEMEVKNILDKNLIPELYGNGYPGCSIPARESRLTCAVQRSGQGEESIHTKWTTYYQRFDHLFDTGII
jgi:hypothetical protein